MPVPEPRPSLTCRRAARTRRWPAGCARQATDDGTVKSGTSDVAVDRSDRGALRLEARVVGAQGVDHVLECVGVIRDGDVVAGVLRALVLQGDVLHVGR